jgi:hypothetical protein
MGQDWQMLEKSLSLSWKTYFFCMHFMSAKQWTSYSLDNFVFALWKTLK